MPTISEQPSRSSYSPSEKPDYEKIFNQIKTGLLERFPQEINYRKSIGHKLRIRDKSQG